ncbi:hypothetical protein C8J56DRAFT_886579 [Mycena floridula]|nr:hypothetical protein C8J56DRAFT_886579 [Mycena floridula]
MPACPSTLQHNFPIMNVFPQNTNIIALLTFSINLAANVFPPDLVLVGTVAFGIAALIAGYIHYHLPHMTLLVLQSLLKEFDSSVKLLADTDHGLWFRTSLQSLQHSMSVCEMEYLQLSNGPWSTYFASLLRLIQSIQAATRETRVLLIAIKSRLAIERQPANPGHITIDITKPLVTLN